MPHRLALFTFLLTALFLLGGRSLPAQTVSISGLYTTGVDANGTLLGKNEVDPNYVITANTAGSTSYNGNAYTVKTLESGWLANTSSARWIVAPNGGSNGNNPTRPSGTYDYTLTFSMPSGAQLGTVSITGSGVVDDTAAIYVNGLLVSGQSINSPGSTNSFTLNSNNAAFVSGTNTITFRVNNSVSGPTGLMITGFSGTAVVPEVGAFLPVAAAVGLCGLGVITRRRNRLKAASAPR